MGRRGCLIRLVYFILSQVFLSYQFRTLYYFILSSYIFFYPVTRYGVCLAVPLSCRVLPASCLIFLYTTPKPQTNTPQCAPVIFRSSRGGSIITLCSNGTDVTGIFASDPRLPTDGAGINISSLSNFSAPADTTSGFAPGETAPGTGAGERARAEGLVLAGVLGAGVVAAALLS